MVSENCSSQHHNTDINTNNSIGKIISKVNSRNFCKIGLNPEELELLE